RQKLYDKALQYYEKALNIRILLLENEYNELRDSNRPEKIDMVNALDVGCGRCYYSIGRIFEKKEEFEKSISYHEKALKILHKNSALYDRDADIGGSYKSLGIAYEKLGNKAKAIENYENAIFTFHVKFGATHKKTLSVLAKLKKIQAI
ncbi:hypothetical protein RFI_38980, partial [Reticulomyxa filosa]